METQAPDGMVIADDILETQRARVLAELDEIARTTKKALGEAEISISLFFMVPSTGTAILTYGTASDPDEELWDSVRSVVTSVLQEIVDLGSPNFRDVACATTGPIVDSGTATLTQVEPIHSR